MYTCYIGVGANLGNRRKNIKLAIKKITALKKTKVIKVSKLIKSDPVGGPPGQGKYLNGAVKIKTELLPGTLLKELKKIEHELGRVKTVRNGPRVIDLDILLYADKMINTKKLVIPHPRMFFRDFVIKPLLEVL